MTDENLGEMHHKGEVVFETQGRLLQELGERLVSNSGVALTELIKNAYDADATKCTVSKVGNTIVVEDTGHGISENDFKHRWMRIASSDKIKQRQSPKYKRKLTGAKGIGRFAVRFLGRELRLNSVYEDPSDNQRYRITATFEWDKIDASADLKTSKIKYFAYEVDDTVPTGTKLTIGKLRDSDEIELSKLLKTQLMSIVSPLSGLERGHFAPPEDEAGNKSKREPGFNLELPGDEDPDTQENLAEKILNRYHARLIISHQDSTVTFTILGQGEKKPKLQRKIQLDSKISAGLHADIRYFPKRKGMFQGAAVNGHTAWKWIYANSGVSVIDHGFRVPPYGYENDDWLNLDQDAARNRRDWRSEIMTRLYPISKPKDADQQKTNSDDSEDALTAEKSNAMLLLPHRQQLIGAVFIESLQESGSKYPTDITPASDREGFMQNAGFRQMALLIRTGLEMLAYVDHKEIRKQERENALKEADDLRQDFKSAVRFVRDIPSLREDDRERVLHEFKELARKLENVEDYHRAANEKMETMALLGVLAGYMTHESTRLISDLDKVIVHLRELAKSDSRIKKRLESIEPTFREFKAHVDYGSMFIRATHDYDKASARPIPVYAQVLHVIERFEHFTDSRNISVDYEGDEELEGPRVPVALYSGVLLNLFSNALKAAVSRPAGKDQPRVVIKAWNEKAYHYLEVVDNGVGIPPELAKRIWDPLFTTTSVGSLTPLGSGMGLGLTLVKSTIEKVKGKITLESPPAGYRTCFRIRVPLKPGEK